MIISIKSMLSMIHHCYNTLLTGPGKPVDLTVLYNSSLVLMVYICRLLGLWYANVSCDVSSCSRLYIAVCN